MWFWLFSIAMAEKLDSSVFTIEGVTIVAEVADEPHERQKGLMHRKELQTNHGMLFVYTEMKHRSFWMKNTLIPLSIAYLDSSCKIVHIANMTPMTLEGVPSMKPAQFALEMNQGWFEEHNVSVGAVLHGLKQCSTESEL